jgi:endogenous inhibitor of DNA gyrase (YacG/DUF329 family)
MKPRCPTCKTQLPDPPPETVPFCGSRCKLADLGSWLEGKYAVVSSAFDEGASFDEESIQPEDSDAEIYN